MAENNLTGKLNDSEFQNEVSKGVVLVDFWAEWCGPCRALAPTIERLSGQFERKARVFKMDVDANPETAARYRVRGLPTVIVFKDGEPVDQLVGLQPEANYQAAIRRALGD